jgi:hypothetical protein
MSQEEGSLFWEVIVSAILNRLYRRETLHVLTPVAKYIDVDGGILENVLYGVNCTNFVT